MLQHLAMILGGSGQPEAAWAHVYAGLHLVDRMHSTRRRLAAFDEAGLRCLELDHPEVGRYFQDELLALALRVGDPEMIAGARLRRARGHLRLGRREAAQRQLAAATPIAARITEEGLRRRLEAEILTARAEASLPANPEAASRLLTEALDFLAGSGYRLYFPVFHFLRGRAHLAAGRGELAERDFDAGLTAVEAERKSFRDPALRIALQDQSQVLFDEALAFLADRGRGDEAFRVSERGHARQLLEALAVADLRRDGRGAGNDEILSALAIRSELPAHTLVVKYAVLEDRLLIWTLRRERGGLRQLHVGRAGLMTRLARVRRGLERGGDRTSLPELRELYRLLVEPVGEVLEGIREIVFVPDRGLALLPFAALVDPRTGRYLAESRAVAVSPSANVYVRCLRRGRRGGGSPESALVVAADGFDRQRFPSLDPLRHVAAEAARVAAAYPQHQLLSGPDARRDRVLAELAAGPQVVHLAGHAVPNPSRPELSMLLLAPDPAKNDSGAVYSHEIYGWRLERTQLVILSACDTVIGKLSSSEGALGLARPFLAAGAPAVLASLGPVDDELTEHLMARFHRRFRAGATPAEALRSAQLSRLHEGGEAAKPGHWGYFEIIGGMPPP